MVQFSTDKFDRSILCLVKVLSNNFGTELAYKEQFPQGHPTRI